MAETESTETETTEETAPQGLGSTGNPNDLATRGPGLTDLTDDSVSANVEHQEGAPEDLVRVVEEAQEKGFLGETTDKPDYSQSNPAVMNQGQEG